MKTNTSSSEKDVFLYHSLHHSRHHFLHTNRYCGFSHDNTPPSISIHQVPRPLNPQLVGSRRKEHESTTQHHFLRRHHPLLPSKPQLPSPQRSSHTSKRVHHSFSSRLHHNGPFYAYCSPCLKLILCFSLYQYFRGSGYFASSSTAKG